MTTQQLLQIIASDPIWVVERTARAYDHGACTQNVQQALDQAKERMLTVLRQHLKDRA